MITELCSRKIGVRRVAGTDFPIYKVVERHEFGNTLIWVVLEICNGVAQFSKTFTEKRKAMKWYLV